MTATYDEVDTGWVITNLALFIALLLAWLWPPKK
jgi:hypothetical protein